MSDRGGHTVHDGIDRSAKRWSRDRDCRMPRGSPLSEYVFPSTNRTGTGDHGFYPVWRSISQLPTFFAPRTPCGMCDVTGWGPAGTAPNAANDLNANGSSAYPWA